MNCTLQFVRKGKNNYQLSIINCQLFLKASKAIDGFPFICQQFNW